MMQLNFSLVGFLIVSSVGWTASAAEWIDIKSGLGRDHAVLEKSQSPETQKLVNELFYDENGQIALQKVMLLLERLFQERENLKKDLIESGIIEGTNVLIKNPKKSESHAKKLPRDEAKVLKIYDTYLIPTIQKLKSLIETRSLQPYWEGLIDDFIRGYLVFFNPNTHPTMWTMNDDNVKIAKSSLITTKFKKDDPKLDEAINLIVEEENVEDIQRCLGDTIHIGHYLTKSEISNLKKCSFDISLLNPGVSPFWENRTRKEVDEFKLHKGRPELFPTKENGVVFDRLRLTGWASPKFVAKALVNGEWRGFKAEWGREVHVNGGSSFIGQFLGFNQDKDQYVDELKVYLGKHSYDQFISLIMSRWGAETVLNTITSHGGEKGSEWVTIRDAMLTARPHDEEERALPLNPTVMDLNHRREFNGRLLFNALLNMTDGHNGNYKFLFGKPNRTKESPLGEDSRPRIFMRFHDLGYGLGPNMYFQSPAQILFFRQKYLPNEFEADGVVTTNKKRDVISIRWNDFHRQSGLFSHATYYDLKWMARKIARLSGDDFEWCLVTAGMSREVAQLYRHKLVSRRNEIIRAFGLDDPKDKGGAQLEEVPDLKTWTSTPEHAGDEPAVKKGVVVASHLAGKQPYIINQNTLPYYLVQLLNAALNLSFIPSEDSPQFTQLQGDPINPSSKQQVKLSTITGLSAALGLNRSLVGGPVPGDPGTLTPLTLSLGVGINATINRSVQQMPLALASEDDHKSRPWVVKDVISFSVGVNSPLLNTLTSNIPLLSNVVSAQASVRLFEVGIELNQFAESYLEGFKKPITGIFSAIANPVEAAANHLGRMELIRKYTNVGFDVQGSGNFLSYQPVFLNQLGAAGGVFRLEDVSYFRDQYGELHVFNQLTKEATAGVTAGLGQLTNSYGSPFGTVAALAYSKGKLYYNTKQRDLIVSRKDGLFSLDTPILPLDSKALQEVQSQADTWEDDVDQLPEGLRLGFSVKGQGSVTTTEKSFLYVFNKSKKKSITHTQMDLHDGNKRNLDRFSTVREKYSGVKFGMPLISQADLLIRKGKQTGINIEMDKDNPQGFTIFMNIVDFLRSGTRDDVEKFIASLNRRFSSEVGTPFYRDFQLPSKEDVSTYRRIYGTTRIYLSGEKLLEKIEQLSVEDFERMEEKFFSEQKDRKYQTQESELGIFRRLYRKVANYRLKSSLSGYFKDLKYEVAQLNRNYDNIYPLLDKFLYHQKIHKYGIQLLLDILGTENMYLLGDISGIFPSFSTANDVSEKQRRRFAAKHWGNFELTQPIQRYVRHQNLMYPSLLIPYHIPAVTMFGHIPNGGPGEDLANTMW